MNQCWQGKKSDLLQNLAGDGSFLFLAGSLESRNYHNRTQRAEKQIREIQKGSQWGAEKRKEFTSCLHLYGME